MMVILKEPSSNVAFYNKDDGFLPKPSINVVSIFNDGSYNKLSLKIYIYNDGSYNKPSLKIYIYIMTVLTINRH